MSENEMPHGVELKGLNPEPRPRRTKHLNFRVTEDIYSQLKSHADEREMSMAEFMEHIINMYLDGNFSKFNIDNMLNSLVKKETEVDKKLQRLEIAREKFLEFVERLLEIKEIKK